MNNFRITSSHDGSRHFRDGHGVSGGSNNSRSFKNQRGNHGYSRRNNNRRGGQNSLRPEVVMRLMDDDVQMDGDSSNSRQSNHGSGSRGGGRFTRGRWSRTMNSSTNCRNVAVVTRLGLPLNQSDTRGPGQDWFRITIPHGRKLEKDFILKQITSLSTLPFVPHDFHIEGNNAVFCVLGVAEMAAIKETSRRITTPDNFKMIVLTSRCSAPSTSLTDEVLMKLKECMSKRYDIASLSLNLTSFSKDADLLKEGINLPLTRREVVIKVLQVISEHIPELKSIDLSQNSLQNLDIFSQIAEKAPRVTSLNLSNNQLRSDQDLNGIDKLALEELCLEGNPLCKRYRDRQALVSSIRKRFPKIIKLDGQVLPPPITFDIEPTTIPETKGSFFANDAVQVLVCRFIEQYFGLYDSDDRQPLSEAYHELANFSLCTYYHKAVNTNKQPSLADYIAVNRNLARSRDSSEREHQLISGQSNIISTLKRLPLSCHDSQSFIVDVTLTMPTVLIFSVQGVFRERSLKNSSAHLRHFTRVFVTVPHGPGIAVTNEMMTIVNVLPELAKKYFVNAPPSASIATSSVAALPPTISSKTDLQKEMVKQFSIQSGMNESFSEMCLNQNEWNYEKAAAVFSELREKNGIPPEAFIR